MTPLTITYIAFLGVLLAVSVYDGYTKKIKNWVNYALIIASITTSLIFSPEIWINWVFLDTVALVLLVWGTVGQFVLGSADFKLTVALLPLLGIINNYFIFLIWIIFFYVVQNALMLFVLKIVKKSYSVPFSYLITIAFAFSVMNIHLF